MLEPEFIQIAIYQNDIVADSANALPRNDKIVAMPEEAEALAFARHDDGDNPSVADVYLHVRDKAEAAAVADIDDLLAFETRKAVSHNLTHPFIL